MAQTMQQRTEYYCTYKNKETKHEWRKSRSYPSTKALQESMEDYLEKNPITCVQYLMRTVWEPTNEGAQV